MELVMIAMVAMQLQMGNVDVLLETTTKTCTELFTRKQCFTVTNLLTCTGQSPKFSEKSFDNAIANEIQSVLIQLQINIIFKCQ
jgi:hypothetical protein